MQKKVYLVDGNSFIYRMFFALPEFSTKDGRIVNAVFGMAKFFVWQLINEKPDYLVFVKDAKGKNFRHEIYSEYKATRDRMPDNLRVQISDIENMIGEMWIDILEISWYEADDVIWTLAELLWKDKDYSIDILTGDKDLYSLVSDNVKIYDTMKKKKFWPEETKEKFWIEPKFIIDYLSIVWDKSDNIPWVAGFWPKKVIPLINNIGWVEEIYKVVEKINSWEKIEDCLENINEDNLKELWKLFKWKTFEKLLNSKDDAFLSKKLATVDKGVKLDDFNLDDYKFFPENILNDNVVILFKDFEFSSLLPEDDTKLEIWSDLWLSVKIVWDDEWLEELGAVLENYNEITLDTETTSLDVMEARLVWVSIFLDEKNIYYINKLHSWARVSDGGLKKFLNNLFLSDSLVIGHNLKYDLEVVENFLSREDMEDSIDEVEQMGFGF